MSSFRQPNCLIAAAYTPSISLAFTSLNPIPPSINTLNFIPLNNLSPSLQHTNLCRPQHTYCQNPAILDMPLLLRIHPHQDIHNAINRRRRLPDNLHLLFIRPGHFRVPSYSHPSTSYTFRQRPYQFIQSILDTRVLNCQLALFLYALTTVQHRLAQHRLQYGTHISRHGVSNKETPCLNHTDNASPHYHILRNSRANFLVRSRIVFSFHT